MKNITLRNRQRLSFFSANAPDTFRFKKPTMYSTYQFDFENMIVYEVIVPASDNRQAYKHFAGTIEKVNKDSEGNTLSITCSLEEMFDCGRAGDVEIKREIIFDFQ